MLATVHRILGTPLSIYAAVAQGVNEYQDASLLHQSEFGNHLSLNSLGLPFAQLRAIEDAARSAIRSGAHKPAEMYLDDAFFHSLRFRDGFEKAALPTARYKAPLIAVNGHYVYTSRRIILDNLDKAYVAAPPTNV
jgi:hypothetical protein